MDYILYEQKGQYAILTINREKALNALNSQVLEELDAALDAVNLDEVRCRFSPERDRSPLWPGRISER